MGMTHVQRITDLIRTEFVEMPGLHLTFWQAQRLWNLTEDICEDALNALLASGFLIRTRDGRFRRPHPERLNSDPVAVRLRLPN